jgi:hypothetical protein
MAKPAELDPRIEAIRVKYGLDPSDFWELPQKKGTWVAKHAALEVAAAKAGILFDNPIIIEANSEAGVAVLAVTGSLPSPHNEAVGWRDNARTEWATGEASPKNNKNAYPWAMAEKRAKDRVILKLIGIHGLVYSEDEMAGSGVEEEPKQLVKTSREAEKQMRLEVDACANVEELERLWRSPAFKEEFGRLHKTYQDGMLDLFRERKAFLTENPAQPVKGYVPPSFEATQ